MLHTKIITLDALNTRLKLRSLSKNKVTITQRANSNRLNEEIMAKHNVGLTYLKALQAFVDRVGEDQTRTLLDEGKDNEYATMVAFETGRRYDKVLVATLDKKLNMVEAAKVRYFVERSTGAIYGAKSDLAPNLKWFFGTLETAHLWDWSGHHGVPKDEKRAGVKEVGGYGEYKHYEPVEGGVASAAA